MTEFKVGDIVSHDNQDRFAVLGFIETLGSYTHYWGIYCDSKEQAVKLFKERILPNLNKFKRDDFCTKYNMTHMSRGLTKEGEISIRIENWKERIK